MILHWFRCVFSKNVLLAAVGSLFFPGQSLVCIVALLCKCSCSDWSWFQIALLAVRIVALLCKCSCSGWSWPPEAVPLSFLCSLKCRLLENVLLAAAGSTFFLHFSMIVEGCLSIFSWFFHDFFMMCLWCFYDLFMIVYALSMICVWFLVDSLLIFFTDCLMILRCFRCVFFKNVLLAAVGSTFSFLDIHWYASLRFYVNALVVIGVDLR